MESWVVRCSRCSRAAVMKDVATLVSRAVDEMNVLLKDGDVHPPHALRVQADHTAVYVRSGRPWVEVNFDGVHEPKATGRWRLFARVARTDGEKFGSVANVMWDSRDSERRLCVDGQLMSLEEFVQRVLVFAFFREVPVVPPEGVEDSAAA